jgi:hypothetical protein
MARTPASKSPPTDPPDDPIHKLVPLFPPRGQAPEFKCLLPLGGPGSLAGC